MKIDFNFLVNALTTNMVYKNGEGYNTFDEFVEDMFKEVN